MDSKGGRMEERKVRKDRERGERTTEREKLSKIRGIKLYFRSARIKKIIFLSILTVKSIRVKTDQWILLTRNFRVGGNKKIRRSSSPKLG